MLHSHLLFLHITFFRSSLFTTFIFPCFPDDSDAGSPTSIREAKAQSQSPPFQRVTNTCIMRPAFIGVQYSPHLRRRVINPSCQHPAFIGARSSHHRIQLPPRSPLTYIESVGGCPILINGSTSCPPRSSPSSSNLPHSRDTREITN